MPRDPTRIDDRHNIAEGFDRETVKELQGFLHIARGSAGEVRSMCLVVRRRPKLQPARKALGLVHEKAKDCLRQITGWSKYLDESPVQGKRHLTPETRARHQRQTAANDLRQAFLLSLRPGHPLYDSAEARAAREAQQDDRR